MRGTRWASWACVLCVIGAAAGCNDERRFVGPDGLYQVALQTGTPAAVENEEGALFIVETRVELPVRRPSRDDLMQLREQARDVEGLPYPRMPWLTRGDIEIEIDYTLLNLSDNDVEVAVIVNGFNEFDEYVPGVTEIEDEPIADFSQWEHQYALDGLERVTGTIREEELDEVAVDLATVVNGAPNSNTVVYFENKSATDERNREFIPPVIPALMGMRLGLRATQAADILLEASVRVRSIENKLTEADEEPFMVNPEPFMPVVPEAP